VAEFVHTIPSGSRVVVVLSTGPLDKEFRAQMEADDIHMPDVMGKSQGVALEELAEIGFKPRVIYDYNDSITKGAVMDQHPAAGLLASPKLESLLLVSSGPSINERVQVNLPNVIGMDEAEATAKLKDAGLSPQIVRYKSSSVEKGKVSAQIPDYESLVAQPEVKSKVAWVIIAVIIAALLALGYFVGGRMNITPPPPVEQLVSQVTVPNLIGLTEEEAALELQKADLILDQVLTAAAEEAPHGAIPGTVFKTIPAQGDQVLAGSPITIILAAEAPGEAVDRVLVPDLSGMDEGEIRYLFEELDLRANVVRAPDLAIPADMVIMQSPAAGTEVAVDSVVTVVVSTGESPESVLIELADVRGLPVSEAAYILQDAGLVVTLSLDDETVLGDVIGQIPESGSEVLLGSVVILEVEM